MSRFAEEDAIKTAQRNFPVEFVDALSP